PKGVISVRRTADDVEVLRLSGPPIEGIPWGPRFSPDDRFLGCEFGNRGAQVWDVRSGHPVLHVPAAEGVDGAPLEFTPDSRQVLITPGDGTIRFHELPIGKEIKRLNVQEKIISSVRCNPKENQLVTLGPHSAVIRIIDSDTGKVIRELTHPAEVT